MVIEDEYKYESTMEQIIFHLEQLMAELLLGSIKRLSGEYEETVLRMNTPKKEKMPFWNQEFGETEPGNPGEEPGKG